MGRHVAVALLLGGLWACGHKGSARLEGHWKGTRADGVGPDQQAAASAFASQMEIDVTGDAITVVTGKDRQMGTYKVLKEDKAGVTIVTDKDGAGDAQLFLFVDDKTMRWAVLEGKTITFVRQ
jgi:hypothetical protein